MAHLRLVRDGLGLLLVALGLGLALLTQDKVGLVIAFAGITLLAYGVLTPGGTDQEQPPPTF
jgi:hypothetical protein